MSNHKNSLVKVLEYLVNDEREKAADLLHNVFVEKAKNHWAAITESDEVVEDDIQDEDLDETIDVSDEEDDFLNDIESAEEEIDQEEIFDDEDMSDEGDDEDMDMSMDMGDIGGDDEDMDMDAPDPEEALTNVEDAIAELRAAFADLMGDDSEEAGDDMDMDMGMDDEDDSEMKGFGESVAFKPVTAKMTNGEDSSAKSPVGKGGKGPTDAKPHPTDTKVEAGGKAPSVKTMSVKGPEAGAKLSAAPAPKREMK
jgi:hypothetical protein